MKEIQALILSVVLLKYLIISKLCVYEAHGTVQPIQLSIENLIRME